MAMLVSTKRGSQTFIVPQNRVCLLMCEMYPYKNQQVKMLKYACMDVWIQVVCLRALI